MSASERVLGTPELLSYILELTERRKDQISAACTSRFWSEYAFHWIWRELDSVVPLLQLLTPLERKERVWPSAYHLHFPKNMTFENWPRLVLYGKHVRYIGFIYDEDDAEGSNYIHVETYKALKAAAANRPAFLPGLQQLEWTFWDMSCVAAIDALISTSITHIQLDLETIDDSADVSNVLALLLGRTPNLQALALTLEPSIRVEEVEESLVALLLKIPQLEQLGLPHFFQSEKLVSTLGAMSRLKTLDCSNTAEYKSHRNNNGCQLRFDEGCFNSLQFLSSNTSLRRAALLFQSCTAPNNLATIYLTPKLPTFQSDLQDFIKVLVSSNPSLIDVNLNLYSSLGDASMAINFGDLQPLLQLRLRQFAISHDLALSYTKEDVRAMGRAWPQLQCLYLTEEPLIYHISLASAPYQDPTILSVFAEHFPCLQDLGLFLYVGNQFVLSKTERPRCRFRLLKEIHVGTSVLPEAKELDVAFFLATLIPDATTHLSIDYSTWYPGATHQRRINVAWSRVQGHMRRMCRAQQWFLGGLDGSERDKQDVQRLSATDTVEHGERALGP